MVKVGCCARRTFLAHVRAYVAAVQKYGGKSYRRLSVISGTVSVGSFYDSFMWFNICAGNLISEDSINNSRHDH